MESVSLFFYEFYFFALKTKAGMKKANPKKQYIRLKTNMQQAKIALPAGINSNRKIMPISAITDKTFSNTLMINIISTLERFFLKIIPSTIYLHGYATGHRFQSGSPAFW